MTPKELGKTLIVDFLDCYLGYHEYRLEGYKREANLIRTATTILVNIQLSQNKKITPRQLWPFDWEKEEIEEENRIESIKAIEEIKRIKRQKDGNGSH